MTTQTSIVLSPSALNLYSECKRCFYLDKVRHIQRPAGKFSSMGSGLDLLLKKHYDAHAQNSIMPHELHSLAERYSLYKDTAQMSEWQRKGLTWSMAPEGKPGITLIGKLDYLLENEETGMKAILDFKTRGFAPKADSSKYYVQQMALYRFLLEEHGVETEQSAYLAFYYPVSVSKEGSPVFTTNVVSVDCKSIDVPALLDGAQRVLKSKRLPAAAKDCGFCAYVKSRQD